MLPVREPLQIGSFKVIADNKEEQQVIISQEQFDYYHKDSRYTKRFTLGSLDGLPVIATDDPMLYRLEDGTNLRKKLR